MQDVLLGILMALLPNMADSGVEADQGFSLYAMIGFRLICGMKIYFIIRSRSTASTLLITDTQTNTLDW